MLVDKKKDRTARGFPITTFKDAYGIKCSIQESSAYDPHLWIGTHQKTHTIMTDRGYQDWTPPEQAVIHDRMHLNIEQVKDLISELQSWVDEHEKI